MSFRVSQLGIEVFGQLPTQNEMRISNIGIEVFGSLPIETPVWHDGYSGYFSVGDAVSQSLYVSRFPTAYSGTSLPDGLSISSEGLLNGTLTQSGIFNSTFFATNASGTAAKTGNVFIVTEAAGSAIKSKIMLGV
jgi:hypothetical protein